MLNKKSSVIIKFDFSAEQTVGEITKIVGLTKAKYLIPLIDILDLEANPRSSATGPVTTAIQDSIEQDPTTFPFKTKGILLASSRYERLERSRVAITPDNLQIEGILDGGHNTLAIGLYILKAAQNHKGIPHSKGNKNWEKFKIEWAAHRDVIDEYLDVLRQDPAVGNLNFYVPVELLMPRDADDPLCVDTFRNDLMEICAARNNNVQLPISDKTNQLGYFDELRSLMDEHDHSLSSRVEWKSNDGGDIKVQDIIALTWIPLSLITPVKDSAGRTIESVLAQNTYAGKGGCLKQFEKLMSSPDVTAKTGADYKRELKNIEVCTAFKIAVELPALYDYIYKVFPKLYNTAGGSYGRIVAVKALNEKRRNKTTPFTGEAIETLSPDGFIMPLVYGLQALMENDGNSEIRWKQDPMEFLRNNLGKIVAHYVGIFSMCDWDPQKIGKNPQSYVQALTAFKMALAGIL